MAPQKLSIRDEVGEGLGPPPTPDARVQVSRNCLATLVSSSSQSAWRGLLGEEGDLFQLVVLDFTVQGWGPLAWHLLRAEHVPGEDHGVARKRGENT